MNIVLFLFYLAILYAFYKLWDFRFNSKQEDFSNWEPDDSQYD